MPRPKGSKNKPKLGQLQQPQSFAGHQKETAKLKRRIIEKVLSNNSTGNNAFNLDLLVDGWLELESDPGTFSLLIEDFGCFGAQVEEVYDLDQEFDGPVFGFIFLFKWLVNPTSNNSRYSNNTLASLSHDESAASPIKTDNGLSANTNANANDQHIDNRWSYVKDENLICNIFFAKQMISNSCATHALISILLNCDYEELNLGPILTRLKEHTKVMNPENKGHAIGNVPELSVAHNSHASYSSLYSRDRPNPQRGASFFIRGNQRTNMQQQNQLETYHFVSYVPINNRLYELDGLKSYPIDHGPFDPKVGWIDKFRRVIKQRLGTSDGDGTMADDIRYNLMAVVPDRRLYLRSRLQNVKQLLRTAENSLKQLEKQAAIALSHRIKPPVSTSVGTDTRESNSVHSSCSNGTAAASETDSACLETINQEVPAENGDNNADFASLEIPNPPYSPLSTCTLTASEAGSEYNHPTYLDAGSCRSDTKSRVANPNDSDKCFFVKFDQTKRGTDEVKCTNTTQDSHTYQLERNRATEDLNKMTIQLKVQSERMEYALKEEYDKRAKYRLDDARRTHNYEPFIMTFLSMLAKNGSLADLIESDLGITSSAENVPQASTPQKPVSDCVQTTELIQPKATNNQTTPQPKKSEPKNTPSTVTSKRLASPRAPPSTTYISENPYLKPRLSHKPHMQSSTRNCEDSTIEISHNKYYKYVSTGRPRGRPRKGTLESSEDK